MCHCLHLEPQQSLQIKHCRTESSIVCTQDVWPTATRLATVYAGGGNGVFGAWDSGLQFTGPSCPYLTFSLGKATVRHVTRHSWHQVTVAPNS